jgi:hypothetical protein
MLAVAAGLAGPLGWATRADAAQPDARRETGLGLKKVAPARGTTVVTSWLKEVMPLRKGPAVSSGQPSVGSLRGTARVANALRPFTTSRGVVASGTGLRNRAPCRATTVVSVLKQSSSAGVAAKVAGKSATVGKRGRAAGTVSQ